MLESTANSVKAMNEPTRIVSDPVATTLALTCLAHLQQEEAMLAEAIDSLRQVRASLRGGSLDSLRESLARQASVAQASLELRERRMKLRRELAGALGVAAQDVTLTMLAARLPAETRTRLTHCRERLNHMAAEVDQINRANAALVRHSLDFLQRLFVDITGGDRLGTAYGPNGSTRSPEVGSIIEARG